MRRCGGSGANYRAALQGSRVALPLARRSSRRGGTAVALGTRRRSRSVARGCRGGRRLSVRPLHVLITVDPYIPVPPVLYGGIERIIDLHVRELVRRGHDVTLLAHPESRTAARLIPYGRPPHFGPIIRAQELLQAGRVLWRLRNDVDVVHSFGRLAAMLPILPLRQLPKIHSYQRDIPWKSVGRAARLAGPSLVFTGCSESVYRERPPAPAESGEWRTIPNSVDPS